MKVIVAVQDNHCVKSLGKFMTDYPLAENAEIRLVHMVVPLDVANYMDLVSDSLYSTINEERIRIGHKYLNTLAEIIRDKHKSIKVEEIIEQGNARVYVHEMIEEWEPDLLVVGSHGKQGLLSLGSVSRDLVTNSKCSVLVVPLLTPEEKSQKVNQKNHIIV